MKLAVPDLISNSYFPAVAAAELGFFTDEGLDVRVELIFPVKCYRALRDGAVDFVGGSAHAALSAFPNWSGVKLIAAQGQGMYWFLIAAVIERDLPYYDVAISERSVANMNAFARGVGILDGDVGYQQVVATGFADAWQG